ncbi:MAG: hypothetical protein HDT29_00565, partial [Clostridiales bacterium]|nr:hypothetical protein [Clostridiales bacterium]
LISETVTAMLPGMQQMLPQQASTNDEMVQKLIDQNEKLMKQLAEKPSETANNDVFVQKLMEQNAQNEERLRKLNEQTEKRVEKLMQQLVEMPAEREVASANISEETLEKLVNKLQPISSNISDETILKVVTQSGQNDETIKQMLKNQELLMAKILELSANQNNQPQVVEKVVEVPVEKVVEKVVEVPVEKIVEKEVVKEVPIEVEKVVEKVVEVPVEKVVEKQVIKEVKVAATPKPKKEVAPRLTLDEAYATLSKEQKKYFDGLRDYALSKDKCKEKKSTYFVVFGPNTANPLLKLTIKKDTVVALYKMEDEYMKDIRRNATSDGSKIKVKETELIVADAQAFGTAKDMIDLREDQIERYADYLKEQKAMNRR